MAKPKRGRSTATIDDHVGARIRERRIMLGLTQQQLAEMIGVTYQQAHKYERGINRVSAGRLFEIARALSAQISYFYEGIGEGGLTAPASTVLFLEEAAPNSDNADSTNDSYHDPRNDRVTIRHRGAANFAFCDGHVSRLKTNLMQFPNPLGDPRFEP